MPLPKFLRHAAPGRTHNGCTLRDLQREFAARKNSFSRLARRLPCDAIPRPNRIGRLLIHLSPEINRITPMSHKKNLRLFETHGSMVLHIGEMEIWDGADMALLRETLTRVIKRDRRKSVGVDMTYVKYIPSGFFGMLFDWYDTGIRIRLLRPQPNVQRMLWFRQFFQKLDDVCHELRPTARQAFTEPRFHPEPDWDEDRPLPPRVESEETTNGSVLREERLVNS